MRVLTWNVLYRNRADRLEQLLQHIQAASPDVVMLQETSHAHARSIADALDMNVIALTGTSNDDVIPATLTRHPGELQTIQRLPGTGRHYVAIADIDTALGAVRFINTHLQHTPSAWRMTLSPAPDAPDVSETIQQRLIQLDAIRDARHALRPVESEILAGDLNFVPTGPEHHAITDWGLHDSADTTPPGPHRATIIARNPLIADTSHEHATDYTLDFQFHSPALTTTSWTTVGTPATAETWPSDHLGILVEYGSASERTP